MSKENGLVTDNHQYTLFDNVELYKLDNIYNAQQEQKIAEQRKVEAAEAHKSIKPLYIPDPKTDNDLMINYQYDYIVNGSEKARGQLWLLAYKMVKVLLRKYLKDHAGKVFISEIDQEEKIHIAVEYVMRRYETRPGYYIKLNFVKAMREGLFHALKYKTKLEKKTGYIEEGSVALKKELYGDQKEC